MLAQTLRRRAAAALLPAQLGALETSTASGSASRGGGDSSSAAGPSTSGRSSADASYASYHPRRGFWASQAPCQRQGMDLSWLGLKSLVVDDAAHRALVQQAFRDGKLSFGFSGGGCLYPYFIGVAGGLRDAGVLTEGVKVGGASAGSLIAAVLQSGMPLDFVTEQCMRFMADLRDNGARGRMGPLLYKFLAESLPHDAHERCTDAAYVSVTQIVPYPRLLLVSQYQDREDLIRALLASCHIPYYLDSRPYTDFRGVPSVDGGLTRFIPLPPQTVGVRICCFPSRQLSPVYRIGISPDSFEPWPVTLRQMIEYSFNPASERFVLDFMEKGRRDAAAWMEEMGLGEEARKSAAAAAAGEGEVAAAEGATRGEARRQEAAAAA